MIAGWLQDGIAATIVALAVMALVRRFTRPKRGCDRCKPAAPRSGAPRRGLPIVS